MTGSLLLYNHPVSSNALKVRFLLTLLGLEYETEEVPLSRPRPEWYTDVNPFGRIPTLVDGEVVLPESNAILRYLANRERSTDLYPDDLARRSRVDYALDAWSTQVRPALGPLETAALFHRDRDTGGGRWEDGDALAVEAARGPAEGMLDLFERAVADNGTVLGSFTIADCAVGPVLWRSLRLPLDFSRWPKTARLRAAIDAHPAFQAAGPVA